MFLVFERPKQKRRAPYGPLIIVGSRVFINVVDGRASRQQPPASSKGPFPRQQPCSVCGDSFEARSGSSAYCSKECQAFRVAEREIEAEAFDRSRRRLRR